MWISFHGLPSETQIQSVFLLLQTKENSSSDNIDAPDLRNVTCGCARTWLFSTPENFEGISLTLGIFSFHGSEFPSKGIETSVEAPQSTLLLVPLCGHASSKALSAPLWFRPITHVTFTLLNVPSFPPPSLVLRGRHPQPCLPPTSTMSIRGSDPPMNSP